jgi:hypothetical protein
LDHRSVFGVRITASEPLNRTGFLKEFGNKKIEARKSSQLNITTITYENI